MRLSKGLSVLSVLFTLTLSVEAFANKCEEVRLGMDIGSGSTKILVANVDTCKKKIIKVLHKDAMQVSFNEDLAKSVGDRLSDEIIIEGESKIGILLQKAREFKPKKESAVATSVFRKAVNGKDIIKSYSRKFKMKFEVISQTEEAVLGYLSANSMVKDEVKKDKKVVAWDIGGGSMQIIYLNDKGEPITYLGDLASVTYKNILVEAIQLKNPEVELSPNPIGTHFDRAVALARAYSKIHVPAALKKAISEGVVVGVGGVHGISIKNQVGADKDHYTQKELFKVAKQQVLKSDKELTGEYKATDISNLLLVLGFMEGLEIQEVNMVSANLLEGLLLK